MPRHSPLAACRVDTWESEGEEEEDIDKVVHFVSPRDGRKL